MLIVLIGWVFFRIENISDSFIYVGRLFGIGDSGSLSYLDYIDNERLIVLFAAVVSSSTLLLKAKDYIAGLTEKKFYSCYLNVQNIGLLFMFVYSIMYINSGSYNPFIYFRF